MNLKRRIGALIVVAGLLAPAPSIGALAEEGGTPQRPCGKGVGDYRPTWRTPLAACGQGTGSHWFVWKIDSPGVTTVGELAVDDFGGRSRIGLCGYYDTDLEIHGGCGSFRDMRDGREGAQLVGQSPVGVEVDLRTPEGTNSGRYPVSVTVAATDFTGYLVLFVLGNFRDYSWWLRTEPPGEIVVEEGDEAYLFTSEDFRGTLTAEAYRFVDVGVVRADVPVWGPVGVDVRYNVGGRANVNTSLELTFPRVFLGGWWEEVGAQNVLTYEGPEGFKSCTRVFFDPGRCHWLRVGSDPAGTGPIPLAWERGDPGTYTFQYTGAGAGSRWVFGPEVSLWAVVPRFPGWDTSVIPPVREEESPTDGPRSPCGTSGPEGTGGVAPAAAGSTERVSVTSDGSEGNDHSFEPAVTADGRYVAFSSAASTLAPGDTNVCADVFVHDRQAGSTERISVASDGTEGNDHSFEPAITADGRHVAFSSAASNLAPGDTNGSRDVFVYDRQTGTTERISVASDGTEGNDHSFEPAVSSNGRYVAFSSGASNLIPGDANEVADIFVHDRQTGATERASVASDGTPGDWPSDSPAMTADGRYVAFRSLASNLVPGDTNEADDIFVHDRQTGSTERVSVASDGAEANWLQQSDSPAITADGRYVAFASYASNLVPGDTKRSRDIFVYDRQTGTTERVSVASDGTEGNWPSDSPAITADGRYVAFVSAASNLVTGDTNGLRDIFVYDRQTGTTERISVPLGDPKGGGDSFAPAISADGRYVAFQSLASNLVSGDTNGRRDVFVRDRGR